MLQPLRRAAVRVVKPRVSDETWAKLRAIDPQRRRKRQPPRALNVGSWGKYRYARRYIRHFQDFRRTRFTLLEIGIDGGDLEQAGGSSLRRWKHFFPKAQIVGLDVADMSFVNEKRIFTYQGSQTDGYLLRSIAKKHPNLKIIIDDGSHRPEHIRATFAVLFPLLPDGGFYAIEDTQTSYWPRFGGSADLRDPATTMGMVKDLVDGLNYEEFGDQRPRFYTDSHVVAVHCYHNLVIIEKGLNAECSDRLKDWAAPGEAYGTEP
jgi:demethylmacrocin O-methyltransferase